MSHVSAKIRHMTNLKIQRTLAIGFIAALTLVGCSTPNETAPPEEPDVEEVAAEEEEVEEAPTEGTRDNPLPLGSTITDGDWTVTVNSVNLDALDQIVNDEHWNDPPADGNVYIMVEATVTYTGTDPQGEMPTTMIDYVTADGNTIDIAWVSYDATDFTLIDPLYEGASHTGSNAYEVPAGTDGTLAVMPSMLSEKTFVALS